MTDKITKKDLKAPDEFVTLAGQVARWSGENYKALVSVSVACVVLVLAVFGWQWYAESNTERASKAFADAVQILDAPVTKDGAPDVPKPEGSYSSDADKYKAALYNFETVKKDYSGSPTASLAIFFSGLCALKVGEGDRALQTFKEYLDREGPSGTLSAFALGLMAEAYEAKGELDRAKETYRRMTEEPFKANRMTGLYHLARIEQKTGEPMKAAELFSSLLDEFPDNPFKTEIQNRLSMLPRPEAKPAPADSGKAAENPKKSQNG